MNCCWVWCVLLVSLADRVSALGHARSQSLLDITINGLPNLFLPNASLGLHENLDEIGRQCRNGQLKGGKAEGLFEGKAGNGLTFTANRRAQESTIKDASHHKLHTAVVLAVGGHSDSHYNYGPGGSINGLMSVWDSWWEHFFAVSSNTTSLVLLFDERDFLRQNHTTSRKDYLDNIVVKNMGAEMVDCIQHRDRNAPHDLLHSRPHGTGHHAHSSHRKWGPGITGMEPSYRLGCSNELHLDQTYRVYFMDPNNATVSGQKPFIIFAAVHKFPVPDWAKNEDENELFKNWKPNRLNRRYPTNYGYVKMTNWYSYHMLNLRVLDFFDYAAKLDNDVSFVSPFPDPNLPLRMATGGHYMLVSANGWYHDDPRISQGVQHCLFSYVKEEGKHCNAQLVPGGFHNPTFWETTYNTTFRAHFLVYWLGLYTAPETVHMAKYWNDWHPRGMWDFRWGDQQWWPRPIGMFGSGNLSKEILHFDIINTDNEKYVVHKQWPRWGTIPKANYYNITGCTKLERDEMYKKAAKAFVY